MDMRAEVWSPLQNTAVWLGAWLYQLENSDELIDALRDLGGTHELADGRGLTDLLAELRRVAWLDAGEPVLRLVLSGPGEAVAIPAGTRAAEAASHNGMGALIVRAKEEHHILVPAFKNGKTTWQWFIHDQPMPAPAWLSPGDADAALSTATYEAAQLIENSGFSTSQLTSPRLSVGTLADFYDTPGLPGAVPARAAKLFARADQVAAIIETVKTRMGEHRIDPQLLGLWRHIRAARMAGVDYALAEFSRLEQHPGAQG